MAIAVSGCGAPSMHDAQAIRGQVFGTSYALKLACSLDSVEARSIVESAFDHVDVAMSTYRQDSELMRLNRSALGSWLAVSEDFARVAAASISLARFTGGAFDPTVGALVDLWGFSGGNVPDQVPTDSDIERLQSNSGWRHLELDLVRPAIRRLSDFSLDLSAIAKGYAVDLAIEALESAGCADLLLEVGGEVGVRGRRMDGEPWVLGIETPQKASGVALTVDLSDASIATSGDYRNQVRIGDAVFSHTIDPATGRPVTHSLASVSVIAETAMRADALATALNVMGPKRGRAFAEAHHIDAYFIVRIDSGYDSFATGRFQPTQKQTTP
ncbi:MAG: FAD:protein FMN transferase [Gammaproteobacteria bacterium]|nr:FAD:protein FMN transferase [Gammaproteobacteria bacterium]